MTVSSGILPIGAYNLLYNWAVDTPYEYIGLLTSLSPITELSATGYYRQRIYTHRKIDDLSFNEVITNFGSDYTPYSGAGDLNFDGHVDDLDFNLIITNFGQTLVNPATGLVQNLSATYFAPAPVAWNSIVGVSIYNSSYSGATIQAIVPLSSTSSLGVGDRFTIPLGKLSLGFKLGTPVFTPEMIPIPAGSFMMGNSGVGDDATYAETNESPNHEVYLTDYSIGKYEVTRGEYRQFIDAGGYTASCSSYWSTGGWAWKTDPLDEKFEPYHWTAEQDWALGLVFTSQPFTQTETHPVVGVTYWEAEAYCNWAGGHLPTEAQWEKAARWISTKSNIYPWGDTWNKNYCNNNIDTLFFGSQTSPVSSFAAGESYYGCQDMAGNAWEWCADWYSNTYYGTAAASGTNPTGPATGTYKIRRGGSWNHGSQDYYRCARREYYGAQYRNDYFGLRIVTNADSSATALIAIPAGTFLMGNTGSGDDLTYQSSNELPRHSVTLSAYWIGKYEVTRGEYKEFMADPDSGYNSNNAGYWSATGWNLKVAGGWTEPMYFADVVDWGSGSFTQTDNHPVIGISWYEAEAYCNWFGATNGVTCSLPTEAQWEKAARWRESHQNIYSWGDNWDKQYCNNYEDNWILGYQSSIVGSYLTDKSFYGCMDMVGNLQEWCKDRYGSTYYATAAASGTDPIGPATGSFRILRGSNWNGSGQRYYRCTYRWANVPSRRYPQYGFRIVKDTLATSSVSLPIAGFTTGVVTGLINQYFGNGKTFYLVLLTEFPTYYPTYGKEVRDNAWPYARQAVTFTCTPSGIYNNEVSSWTYLSNTGTFGNVVGIGVIEELSSDLSNLLAFTRLDTPVNMDTLGDGNSITVGIGEFNLQSFGAYYD